MTASTVSAGLIPFQLVRDADRTTVWAQANPDGRSPRSFDDRDRGVYVPRWGSVALLACAATEASRQLVPVEVDILDGLRPTADTVAARAAEGHVLRALAVRDIAAAREALADGSNFWALRHIAFRTKDAGEVRFGRLGSLAVSDGELVPHALAIAEQVLHIS